jgi:hypothetical protein
MIRNPELKNGWEKSTRRSRSAVIVIPAAATSASPVSSAAMSSGLEAMPTSS